jgi:RHS repeat-associated protein
MSRFSFLSAKGFLRSFAFAVTAALLAQLSIFSAIEVHAAPPQQTQSSVVIALRASRAFEEPLVPTGETSSTEDQAIADAIATYQKQTVVDDFSVFDGFLSAYPKSNWRAALYTDLGLAYYHYGYFSKAIDALEHGWKDGRNATSPDAKVLVDRAVGELARMHARLGHADRLATLIDEIGDRAVTGPATEAITGAKEGLWMMRNNPGIAYLCGPMALKNLLLYQRADAQRVRFLGEYRSGPIGVSLAEVGRLAKQANLQFKLVFREGSQPIPIPAIVHWKVNHFAVLVGEQNGRFHIKDPTFGTDIWMTRAALDSESSGYFLLPVDKLAPGFREVALAEASGVHGMGFTTDIDPQATRPSDDTIHSSDPTTIAPGPIAPVSCHGMCGYDVHELAVSLNLKDTPVGYAPPRGPAVYVTLTYDQREAGQPANFNFFNISPKWTLNWLSYIQDDPTLPGANVSRYVAGGGYVNYPYYDASSGYFFHETDTKSAANLIRVSGSPITYWRVLTDGSREVYAQGDGATTFPRRIFLSQIFDRAGNVVTLNYDNQMRLLSVTDATLRNTTFSYEIAGRPLIVTKITDPFGRSATLTYDTNGRLNQITDVIGLNSRFTYDANSQISAMTTPYGTTSFDFGQGTDNNISRFIEITDPLGYKERVEYRQGAPGIPFSESPVPNGIDVFECCDHGAVLDGRNTFYWDKLALPLARGDYTKARIRHWLHDTLTNYQAAAPVIESVKYPFERRIWMNYPDRSSGAGTGSLDKPAAIARVLDDGSTQITRITYNYYGKPTQIIDPIGRVTSFDYDDNLIDLIGVSQKTSASSLSTTARFTYNNQHLPLTYTDAAGQTTLYSYNGAGQLTQVTNPLGQTTKYQYDGLGYLTRVVNANGQTAANFTYDGFGRIATRTDSEGHAVAFAYDAMDRITQATYPDGTFYQFTWDKLDLAAGKDRLGRITTYSHDAVRNLKAVADPLSRITRYAYYGNQQFKSLTDANGNTTSWDRDLEGRVTAKHFADGSQIDTAYELTTSRTKSVTDALGQEKRYGYALDDRLASIDYVDALNATPSVYFTYDPYFPRVTSMTDGSGATQFQYQAVGAMGALKLLAEDGPFDNDAIAYQYDALGRVVARVVDSSAESFSYDTLGRLASHSSPLGTFTFGYLDQTRQVVSQQLSTSTVGTSWSYGSNINDRRLKSITNSGSARSFQYTTTPENRITQLAETAGVGSVFASRTWNYSYDGSDRLLGAQSSGGAIFGYGYDLDDNITSALGPNNAVVATFNNVNQISSINGVHFSYDASGNLIDDGQRTYQWDAENRLIAVVDKSPPRKETDFTYDGLGRRIAITSNSGNGAVNARYLWCGSALCQARTPKDVVTRRYYPEGELHAEGQNLYYARDHLGSVRDSLVTASGSPVASFDYDPYGNFTRTAGNVLTDFRYAGMFFDEDSGLYLTQYRAYDPKSARWLSRDPLQERAGANLYSYVKGSPVMSTDPSGSCDPLCVALIISVISLVEQQAYYMCGPEGCAPPPASSFGGTCSVNPPPVLPPLPPWSPLDLRNIPAGSPNGPTIGPPSAPSGRVPLPEPEGLPNIFENTPVFVGPQPGSQYIP